MENNETEKNTISQVIINEVEKVIAQLHENLYVPYDMPSEIANDPVVIDTERKLGIRAACERGYDVIADKFYVKEKIKKQMRSGAIESVVSVQEFDIFADYFAYLRGEIYSFACYYGYKFSDEELANYSIDMSRLNFESLLDYTINDFTLKPNISELQEYKEAERVRKRIKEWLSKFNNCDTYNKFVKTINKVNQSSFAKKYKDILICEYINNHREEAFPILIQYVNSNWTTSLEGILCLLYDPNIVLKNYGNVIYSRSAASKHKLELKKFVERLNAGTQNISKKIYFDKEIKMYVHCLSTSYNYMNISVYHTFETFEEFALFLKNDLSDCNLLNASIPKLDKSKYCSNENTIWPLEYQSDIYYSVIKRFDQRKNKFVVAQRWLTRNKILIKEYRHTFDFFIDFVKFLNKDLSNANLLFCDGLENVKDLNIYNLSNAKIRGVVESKLDLGFVHIKLPSCIEFSAVSSNELATINNLEQSRSPLSWREEGNRHRKIFYLSDIHLPHRLSIAKCINDGDIEYTLRSIVEAILRIVPRRSMFNPNSILLIGGDTSSDYKLFERFIRILNMYVKGTGIQVVFTLGNHELWDFNGYMFKEIVSVYRKLLNDNNMYLLQNSILFSNDSGSLEELSDEQILGMSPDEAYDKVRSARTIIFGGLGFAGKNMHFNADHHIYRSVINRQQEIAESIEFEMLYNKVCASLSTRNVIVLTHMPKADWSKANELQGGFTYVNGHSHKNLFYDDGIYRIYADNQIGYYAKSLMAKCFYVDCTIDIFGRYLDGIYEITADEYRDFYRKKNIRMEYNRSNKLYMIKKNGYYMFINEYENGTLYILNGGAIKKLPINSLEYYYNNIEHVVAIINPPLQKFTEYQTSIAGAVKSFGGSGVIHGAIVDIDFFNHIYVNPIDMTITPYWADDIIHKIVYPSVPALLEDRCPQMFIAYKNLSDSELNKQLILQSKTKCLGKEVYLSTDIYRASNEIKKMQKLIDGILTTWIDPKTGAKEIKFSGD